MPRIPYANPETMSDEVKSAIAQAPINVVRMMAGASPAVFEGFGKFSGAFYRGSSLPADLREVAILRTGFISKSKYEVFQHVASARTLGMSDAVISAIEHGGEHPGVLNAAQQAVLGFTEDVVRNVRASDKTLAEVRKHLNDAQTLDLILVIGLYMTVSRFLGATGVELDQSALNWKKVGDPRSNATGAPQ